MTDYILQPASIRSFSKRVTWRIGMRASIQPMI